MINDVLKIALIISFSFGWAGNLSALTFSSETGQLSSNKKDWVQVSEKEFPEASISILEKCGVSKKGQKPYSKIYNAFIGGGKIWAYKQSRKGSDIIQGSYDKTKVNVRGVEYWAPWHSSTSYSGSLKEHDFESNKLILNGKKFTRSGKVWRKCELEVYNHSKLLSVESFFRNESDEDKRKQHVARRLRVLKYINEQHEKTLDKKNVGPREIKIISSVSESLEKLENFYSQLGGADASTIVASTNSSEALNKFSSFSNKYLCDVASHDAKRFIEKYKDVEGRVWSSTYTEHVAQAKRRGLSCGVDENVIAKVAKVSPDKNKSSVIADPAKKLNVYLMFQQQRASSNPNRVVCNEATVTTNDGKEWIENDYDGLNSIWLKEAKRRGLNCGVDENVSTQVASKNRDEINVSNQASSLQIKDVKRSKTSDTTKVIQLAQQEEDDKAKKAEEIRLAKIEEDRILKEKEAKKVEEIRLAKIEEDRILKEEEAKRLAAADKNPPQIFAEVVSQDGYDAQLRGVVSDDTGLKNVAINGQLLELDSDGKFELPVYIPRGGKLLLIEAIDTMGKLSRFEIKIEREKIATLQLASFDELFPSNRKAKPNQNAVAVIIGISEYQRTDVPAIYADQDARFFYDYATLKLGVPEKNIIELVNEKADAVEIFLATENFLKRKIKTDKTDVYVFYAGHGLAKDDGSEMYLLPYDGAPQLLEKTAISRKQFFNDIALARPKSVTVFLDTCYSGTTRGKDTLIASRPIAIKAKPQTLPDNFTVLTAAAGDQTAKPLEEAKHGMFSYFLMKGMEGDADANQDNQITAGELHAYVQENVVQQSSGSQTPELQGDADRVLVQFQ